MTGTNGVTKFTPGPVAEVIALAGPGEEVKSAFSPYRQMRYTLTDGRTWFASLAHGTKIHNLELQEGEPFRVCKRVLPGGGNAIDILRCAAQAAPAVAPTPALPRELVAPAQNSTSPATVSMPVNGQGESAMEIAMKAAIDVCYRGMKYAASKGMQLVFTGEDVRALAITQLIGTQKGAR